MGNFISNDNESVQTDGSIPEKHENGAVNGISLTVTANGHTVDVPAKILIPEIVDSTLPEIQSITTEAIPVEPKSGPPDAEITPPDPSHTVHTEEKPEDSDGHSKVQNKEQKTSVFRKMFKTKPAPAPEQTPDQTTANTPLPNGLIHGEKENGVINESSPKESEMEVEPTNTEEIGVQAETTESTEFVVAESEEKPVSSPSAKVLRPARKVSVFSKMFKKQQPPASPAPAAPEPAAPEPAAPEPPAPVEEEPKEELIEDQSNPSPPVPVQQPESEEQTAETEVEEGDSEPKDPESDRGTQDSPEEENPVMNFFKTLVTPTKTRKDAQAPDATKEQPQPSETQPQATTTTTVAQVSDPQAPPKGMPVPPPPPPEPPRVEAAAKAVKPKEEAKTKDSPKAKSAKGTLTRLFKSKKPDASKASTLEAAAKPAQAPAAQEEKKPEAKKSLLTFFKPKAWLDRVSTTVQAASSSGVQFIRKTTGAAADPKATASPAAAAAEAAPAPAPAPVKEETPKAAKSTEATAESKPAAVTPAGEEVPPKRLEKRNSITLFFKNLSGKRPSTDAGATEAPAASAEKSK